MSASSIPLQRPTMASDGLGFLNERRLPGVKSGTLLTLRWLAIIGQILAVLFVSSYLGFSVPTLPLTLGIAASVVFNLALFFFIGASPRLTSRQAALQLAFDQLQLAVLLYFTGGLQNPFSVMMLLPLTISATMLSGRATIFMLTLATACLLFLTRAHLPLPWSQTDPLDLSPTYLLGLWAALTITMVFIAGYAYRVSAEARKRAEALVALQSALNREQRLSAVGSVAAAAAHELGTPLGTIALVVQDLRQQRAKHPELEDDFALLEEQALRCKDILADISRRSDMGQEHFLRMPIAAIVREVVKFHEGSGVDIHLTAGPMPGGTAKSPVVARAPELRHGVANFIGNAVRFAHGLVEVDVSWDDAHIHLVISDDGPGFSEDILPLLGEPFVESAPGARGSTGMGLGVFISTTLLERTGATLQFENEDGGGAVVDITWPLARLEEDGDIWDNAL